MAAVTRRQYKGAAAATTITAGINPSDLTCSLAATIGWPSTASVSFYVVIDPGTSAEEKCSATIAGSTLTLTRAADDTTAVAHSSGATIYPVFSADEADEANLFASTMTTRGDLLTMGSGPTVGRVALGTSGYALTSNGTDVVWGQVAAAGLATDSVTKVKISDRAVGSAELDGISINAGTTSAYTLVAGDANRVVTFSATTTLTVPASVFSVGDQINILQTGAGQVTVVAGGSVTLRSESSRVKTRAQYAMATVICIASNEFVVLGNVVA